jgi:hypothetical protein
MQIMNGAKLKKLWKRSKKDQRFRRLLHLMLVTLATVPSKAKDQFGACALAAFILQNAGAEGRRDLKQRLAQGGVVGHLV